MASVMKKKFIYKIDNIRAVSIIRSEFTMLLISFNGFYYANMHYYLNIILTVNFFFEEEVYFPTFFIIKLKFTFITI